jgi:hypothetical protein
MTMRRTVALVIAATACFATVACGGDDSDDAATTTTAAHDDTASATTVAPDDTAGSDTTAADGDDPGACAWLSTDDATAAIGVPMSLVAAGPGGCYFATESGDGPAVQISSIQIAIAVDDYVEQSRALCKGEVVDVDAGDGGWACNAGINPQGLVVFGRELVVADVSDAASEAEGIQLAAAVAAHLSPG